jgi:hypothetical protein
VGVWWGCENIGGDVVGVWWGRCENIGGGVVGVGECGGVVGVEKVF